MLHRSPTRFGASCCFGCLLSLGLSIVLMRTLPSRLGWGQYGFGPPVRVTDIRKVRYWTGLQFPSDAVLVDGYFLGGLFAYQIAKIRLPRKKVKGFIAQPPIGGRADNNTVDSLIQADGFRVMKQHGWQLPHPRTFLSTGFFKRGYADRGVSLLIDLDDSRTAVLYLYYWH